jgi:hypothetical protein
VSPVRQRSDHQGFDPALLSGRERELYLAFALVLCLERVPTHARHGSCSAAMALAVVLLNVLSDHVRVAGRLRRTADPYEARGVPAKISPHRQIRSGRAEMTTPYVLRIELAAAFSCFQQELVI